MFESFQILSLFEQLEQSELVVSLARTAINIAEDDDPNIVSPYTWIDKDQTKLKLVLGLHVCLFTSNHVLHLIFVANTVVEDLQAAADQREARGSVQRHVEQPRSCTAQGLSAAIPRCAVWAIAAADSGGAPIQGQTCGLGRRGTSLKYFLCIKKINCSSPKSVSNCNSMLLALLTYQTTEIYLKNWQV